MNALPDCIEWQGARSKAGYGQRRVDGKVEYVHRLVMRELHVPIAGMVVRHHCDNPPCVNPDHLTVGTKSENIMDAIDRGQWTPPMTKGECIGTAKLTEYAVRWIRSYYSNGGYTQTELAEQFGVSQSLISEIVNQKSWRHIS